MAFSGPPRDAPGGGWRHSDRARDDYAARGDYESRDTAYHHHHHAHHHPQQPRQDAYSRERRRSRSRSRSRTRSRSRSPRRFALSSHTPTDGPPRQWAAPPPSATLIVRGLTPTVSDPMLLHALEAFRPTSVRVMFHKTTGEHRGFAFANFDSVQTATAVMDAFSSQPLIVDNQPVTLVYADSNRPSPHFQRQQFSDNGPSGFGAGPPRLDWICDQCGASNFGRRAECFKCHVPKPRFAMEVPSRGGPPPRGNFGPPPYNMEEYHGQGDRGAHEQGYGYSDDPGRREPRDFENEEPPSHVLAVRMIPLDVDEGELQVVFAEFEGVRDIRLIRDRATNQSRGFAFVEFEDVESAQRVRNRSDGLSIRGEMVRVGYARETFQPRPPQDRVSGRFENPVPMNPVAAAALEQAQWAMANNYGAMHQPAAAEQSAVAPPVGMDDLDALLNDAAAAARPHIDEPKKPWPQPFETGGGMYIYASESGLYYDTDSMFYYDPHSKIYFSSFTGQYYRCPNGAQGASATFEPFSPPVPSDNAAFAPDPPASTLPVGQAVKRVALSLATKDKKKPLISFSLKTTSSTSVGKPASVFASDKVDASPASAGGGVNLPFGSGVSMASAASASIRKKSAMDIAKWSQRQKEESTPASEPTIPKQTVAPHPIVQQGSPPVATTSSASTVDVPLEAPICLLCRRKFGSMEQLRKHETQSKLHAENLAKAKQDKAIVAAQVRERDEEEREELQNRKRPRPGSAAHAAVPVDAPQPPPAVTTESAAAATLETGIGAKMLKMMGWKKGEGLGKHGTGITAPVEAVGNAGAETTGLGAKTTPAINVADVASYKERLQKMARARYDAADIHDAKNM